MLPLTLKGLFIFRLSNKLGKVKSKSSLASDVIDLLTLAISADQQVALRIEVSWVHAAPHVLIALGAHFVRIN